MNRNVKVHTCLAEVQITKELEPGRRYYTNDPRSEFFIELPEKCKCKKMVSFEQAKIFITQGKAYQVYLQTKKNRLIKRYKQIAFPIDRSKTPRVDLITQADIERAYIDKREDSQDLIEAIHRMIMDERRKWIVPFKPDPQEGRLLFPFGPDQRTAGGHS